MSKAKILNRAGTMVLILLLTLSMIGVIRLAFVNASPGLTLTPNHGKVKTMFMVSGTEFGINKTVGIGFGNEVPVTKEPVGTGDGSKVFYLDYKPVKPGSESIYTDTTVSESVNITGTDTGPYNGTLTKPPIKPGSITLNVTATWGNVTYNVIMIDLDADGDLEEGNSTPSTGKFGKGFINYATGEFNFNFTEGPTTGPTTATANYTCALPDYTLDYATGTITFTSAPASGVAIKANYRHYQYDITPTTVPTTNATGYFEALCEVPLVETGTYTVTAIDEEGHYGTASFTVDPGITLVPSRGVAGSIIRVYGSGFTEGETVWIYFDATSVGNATAQTGGTLNTTFAVPSGVSVGTHVVTAIGEESGNSYKATFTVPPLSITLTPNWGSPGKRISVTGEGFTRYGLVDIYFDAEWVKSARADGYGNISTSFTVPLAAAPGTHTVKANDTLTRNIVTKSFTVPTPSIIKVEPTWGPSNSTVTITGANFTIGGRVGIYFGTQFAGNLTADETGGISGSIRVPSLTPGTYAVKGKDWSNLAWSTPASFTVPKPSITLTPDWGPPNRQVTINGYNFTACGKVRIYFGITPVDSVTADSSGSITYTLMVPKVLPGLYTIKAIDLANNYYVTAPFTVPTPAIQLNPDGGPPGTRVTVTGGNFTIGGEVRIYFDTTSVANVTRTGINGDFSTDFTVPPVAVIGPHTVRAYDVETTYNATAIFTVGPVITISPTTGPPATKVTVTGSGFTANQTVQIYFDTTLVKSVNASLTGTIDTWFLIPDATAGTHHIKAYDVNTSIWTPPKDFTIPSPTITLNITSGYPGTSVKITGSNFKLNATVTIYFAGAQWGATVTSGPAGSFIIERLVPDKLAGNYTVSATDGVNIATTWFIIKSTAGGIEEAIAKIDEVKAKLDQYWNFTNNWFTIIQNAISSSTSTILNAISGIDAKLGVFHEGETVASLLYDIQGKLNSLPAWGDIVTKNWTDLTGYIDSAKSEILNATSGLDAKLGTFTNTDTVASLLYNIRDTVTSIEDSLVGVELDVGEILNKLNNETYGLIAIKNAISGIDTKLGNFSNMDTVASLLYEIKASTQNITATVDFTPVLNAISGLDTKLGNLTGTDTVASLLYDIRAKVDTIGSDTKAVKDLLYDPLWGIYDIQGNIDALWYRIDLILAKLDSWFGTSGTYSKTAQVSVANGTGSADAGVETTLYESTTVSTIHLTVKITTTGNAEVRFYTDPTNPAQFVAVASNSWSGSGAAWKVTIIATAQYNYTFALTSTHPPTQ